MRLINTDKWIEDLSKCFVNPNYHPDLGDAFQCIEVEKHNEENADLIMMINEQPMAYDIDKVIEQLRSFSRITNELGVNSAIEIVKKGGIE